jgi:periplasmic protein CpxP/Spy
MKPAFFLAAFLAAGPVLSGWGVSGSGSARAATPAPQTEQQAADQRIQSLQQGLEITAEQMPQWNSFAQAMRDNASATDTLFRERATNTKTMNATDNMKSYAAVARAYADNTQKLSDAFDALYHVLSDHQKQIADTMFRQQPESTPKH